jgi:multimeric flavodoxin WrbA
MKIGIFNGSVRKNGNTAAVTSFLRQKFEDDGADVNEHFLFHMNIKGCLSCGTGTGREKAEEMVRELISSDLVILASPIYMWRLADSMTSLLDVLHSMCREDDSIANAVDGKRTAIVLTSDTDEDAISGILHPLRQFCIVLKMDYLGAYTAPFATKEKISGSKCQEEMKEFVIGLLN